jgi:hypothetical protein
LVSTSTTMRWKKGVRRRVSRRDLQVGSWDGTTFRWLSELLLPPRISCSVYEPPCAALIQSQSTSDQPARPPLSAERERPPGGEGLLRRESCVATPEVASLRHKCLSPKLANDANDVVAARDIARGGATPPSLIRHSPCGFRQKDGAFSRPDRSLAGRCVDLSPPGARNRHSGGCYVRSGDLRPRAAPSFETKARTSDRKGLDPLPLPAWFSVSPSDMRPARPPDQRGQPQTTSSTGRETPRPLPAAGRRRGGRRGP